MNSPPHSSTNVPSDLPSVAVSDGSVEREAQWEKRATVLVGAATTEDLAKPPEPNRSRRGSVGSHVDDVSFAIVYAFYLLMEILPENRKTSRRLFVFMKLETCNVLHACLDV